MEDPAAIHRKGVKVDGRLPYIGIDYSPFILHREFQMLSCTISETVLHKGHYRNTGTSDGGAVSIPGICHMGGGSHTCDYLKKSQSHCQKKDAVKSFHITARQEYPMRNHC